jgi:hypothetical protein
VSSILDALRKLEEAETPRAARPLPPEERPRTLRWAVAGFVVAFAAGAAVSLWLRRPAPSPPVEPEEAVAAAEPTPTPPTPPAPEPLVSTAPAPVAPPAPPVAAPLAAGELPPAAAMPPPSRELAEIDPPRGRIVASAEETPAPPRPAPPPRTEAPAAKPEPAPPVEVARPVEPPPEPPRPVEDDGLLPRLPSGAPHVQVNFLVYSRAPERRTVALTIDGGAMTTLHEGEQNGAIEIVRILSDRIHVRYDGRLFSVRAHD